MAVKHDFVSAKPDDADGSLVRPSNWNADHTIEPGTITYAQLSTAAVTQIISEVPGTPQTGTFLISGGGVAWVGNLDFIVAAAVYQIAGTQYTSAQDTVTLNAGDATNPRIDVIALDTAGAVVVIEGTPAADPSAPTVDAGTQLALTFVLVDANATTPGGTITNTVMYAENTGPPTEFTTTSNGSGWTLNSVADPHAGSTHITAANVGGTTSYVQFQAPAPIDPTAYERLVFYVKVTAAWNTNRWLQLVWLLNGVEVGTVVELKDATFGFSRSLTTDYQVIIVPTLLFNIPIGSLVNQLRIRRNNTSGIDFRLDDVSLQLATTGVQPVQGLTQEQADARYVQLGNVQQTDLQRLTDLQLVDGSTVEHEWERTLAEPLLYRVVVLPCRELAATGNITLAVDSATYQFIDGNGSNRDITSPTEYAGLNYVIFNTSDTEVLTFKSSGGSTVSTIAAGAVKTFIYTGTAWRFA